MGSQLGYSSDVGIHGKGASLIQVHIRGLADPHPSDHPSSIPKGNCRSGVFVRLGISPIHT